MNKGTVLVVEDEAELREMLGDALRFGGFSVVTAKDGQHAFELLAAIDRCSVIILDLVMPRMDGWMVLERLGATPALSDIPVIVHTSSPLSAPATAKRVFQKPVDLDRLFAAVREYCGADEARSGAVALERDEVGEAEGIHDAAFDVVRAGTRVQTTAPRPQ